MDMAVSDHGAAGNRGEGFSALPADARPLAIEARGLVKSFDGTRAVDGVDISVPEGAIYGILGPKGLPKDVVTKLNNAFNKALQDPALKQKLSGQGADVQGSSAADFAKLIRDAKLRERAVREMEELKQKGLWG